MPAIPVLFAIWLMSAHGKSLMTCNFSLHFIVVPAA